MLPSKRRNTKKNKLEEVVKPRGFERGLQLDKIVGVTNCKNELMFLLKWHDCLEYDLVKACEVNEKCPEVVIEYYEARCPINQKSITNGKSDEKYKFDLIDNPPPIREENIERDVEETKIQNSETEMKSESVQDSTAIQDSTAETLPDLKVAETGNAEISSGENDVVNAAFSINVDDTNSVQVSYSLPLIENQPGEELMETSQVTEEQGSHDTSNCHMPDLQDVEMQ